MKLNVLASSDLLKKAVIGSSLFLSLTCFAAEKYVLCGPDEDGCYRNIYQYCNCIPYNEEDGSKPYCLDFDTMRCHPLSQVPDCNPALISKDQASCLATIFQSEPEPGCRYTTQTFCIRHNMYICDEDGHPDSCHKVNAETGSSVDASSAR